MENQAAAVLSWTGAGLSEKYGAQDTFEHHIFLSAPCFEKEHFLKRYTVRKCKKI